MGGTWQDPMWQACASNCSLILYGVIQQRRRDRHMSQSVPLFHALPMLLDQCSRVRKSCQA